MRPSASTLPEKVVSLLSKRDELITEIEIVRSTQATPSPAVRKARTLLTRFWAHADWRSREEILRAASWLLHVCKVQRMLGAWETRKRKGRTMRPLNRLELRQARQAGRLAARGGTAGN